MSLNSLHTPPPQPPPLPHTTLQSHPHNRGPRRQTPPFFPPLPPPPPTATAVTHRRVRLNVLVHQVASVSRGGRAANVDPSSVLTPSPPPPRHRHRHGRVATVMGVAAEAAAPTVRERNESGGFGGVGRRRTSRLGGCRGRKTGGRQKRGPLLSPAPARPRRRPPPTPRRARREAQRPPAATAATVLPSRPATPPPHAPIARIGEGLLTHSSGGTARARPFSCALVQPQ